MKRLIIATFFGILFAHAAQAAVLTVSPPNAADQVVVSLDTQGESVNAIEAHLTFDPSDFSISGVSDGGSIVDLWIQTPIFSNTDGTIDLSGIIPNGADVASGTIVTISIVPQISGISGGFQVASATALLNDGKGTPATLTIESAPFSIATTSSTPSSGSSDTQAPSPFLPQIASDPLIFNGKYFLSFATTDQNSGINHYEVLEVPTGSGSAKSSGWQVAQSPYLLKDQTLSSNIYVRAVDNAGNFRMVEVPAEHPAMPTSSLWSYVFYVALGCAIILVFCVAFFIMRRKRK